MSQTFAFYDQRARESAAEADKATLARVRERSLRSEKTWRDLADRAKKIEDDRATAEAERAERRAREQEEQRQLEENQGQDLTAMSFQLDRAASPHN